MSKAKTVKLGQFNRLQVIKHSSVGLFLDGYEDGEILLPKRYVNDDHEAGVWLEVFVYADSEERLIATTDSPKAEVGSVAHLKVVAVTDVGAFVDWGLPKDILVPYAEQSERMREGQRYSVYLYVDRYKSRIVASSKLSKFLPEHSSRHRAGDEVELQICGKSELGFKCLVDGEFLALLHHGDVFTTLEPGRRLRGYIKRVRTDGRIDLSLSPPGANNSKSLEQEILHYLADHGGSASIGDKSPPDEIYRLFHTSKKNFKRALGKLYKDRKIAIEDDGIRLPSP